MSAPEPVFDVVENESGEEGILDRALFLQSNDTHPAKRHTGLGMKLGWSSTCMACMKTWDEPLASQI